ncbi:MAG: BMC domain-containing protein, partial [Clostridia bacterium]|nr:BMC domain-containing protein [Clostridia bacterium]
MALGMLEVYGFTTAIIVADKAAKTAPVKVVAIDKNKP